MALFDRNPNEVAYVHGKKHWTDVIKNSGGANQLIWRQPEEDFNTNSTLVVMPGESAIFVNEGKIEQVFENGTYKLSTHNYPFISRLKNAFSGGISTFNCVVYFVRKTDSEEIRWGTRTPIQVRDKVWGIRTEARARGAYKVRIDKPALFLEKIVGNNTNNRYQVDLNAFFAEQFQGTIKSAVSKFLNGLEQELIGLDAHIDKLSLSLAPHINDALAEYGLICVNFVLSGLDIDTSKYDALDESQIDVISRRRMYQSGKEGVEILGEDWGRVQGAEILKDMANNEGGGSIAAAGAGIGLGMGAAEAFSGVGSNMFSKSNTSEDPVETLTKLKKMLDAGLIEQAEYDAKKAEVLSRM